MEGSEGDKTAIKNQCQYLDKVHMDIFFGDCVALGGHRYALLLVDVATRYCWLYRMSSLSSTSITSATEQFKSDAGRLSHWFHSNSDRKSIGGNDLQWILLNGSNIITAPDGRQSSNGLAKHTWRNLKKMARALITDKQVGREFWYSTVRHS